LGNSDVIRDCDFHPGEPHVRVFSFDRSSIVRWDDLCFVSDSLFGDAVLRHYAFRDEWFKVNVTTDRNGRIVETPPSADAPAVTFNFDIATPMRREGNAVYTVELFADVLVRDDGTTFEVGDRIELDAAVSKGSISPKEHRQARDGVDRLIELIHRKELISFLNDVYPFGESRAQPAQPMQLVPVDEVPLVQSGPRPSW
jgi:hypothetical protein